MSTSSGPIPACSNAAAAASAVGDGADSIGIEGLKTSKEPKRRVRKATERRWIGVRARDLARSARARTRATAPSPGRAEHVLGERVVDHLGGEHLLLRERPPPPGVGIARAVLERLRGDLGQRRRADAVLGHVALDLHREELRREHQAGLAVPGAKPPVLGQWVERAGRVLVEADHERDLG
jgi:hypothetical protein